MQIENSLTKDNQLEPNLVWDNLESHKSQDTRLIKDALKITSSWFPYYKNMFVTHLGSIENKLLSFTTDKVITLPLVLDLNTNHDQ